MSDNFQNPYAQPTFETQAYDPDQNLGIPPADLKKIRAVIKDAKQFWLGILLCFLCSGLGMVIIGVWYLVRLIQWNGLSRQYPVLMQADAFVGSLPAQFQSSKWKLVTGMCVGGILLFLLVLVLAITLFAGPGR